MSLKKSIIKSINGYKRSGIVRSEILLSAEIPLQIRFSLSAAVLIEKRKNEEKNIWFVDLDHLNGCARGKNIFKTRSLGTYRAPTLGRDRGNEGEREKEE